MGVYEDIDAALRIGDLDAAIAKQTDIPVNYRRLPEYNERVVDALIKSGRIQDAENLARSELRRRPKDPIAFVLLAKILRHGERWPEATEALGTAFHLAPDDESLAASYSLALRSHGCHSAAEEVDAEHRRLLEFSMDRLSSWTGAIESARETKPADVGRKLYLDLLERTIANLIYQESYTLEGAIRPYEAARRNSGKDIPTQAHSMIGLRRLRQTREAACQVIETEFPVISLRRASGVAARASF